MPDSQQQSLKDKWRSLTQEQRDQIASKAGTTTAYLRQVLACGRKPGAEMAKNIELASGGDISRQVLRPDLFADLIQVA